MRFLITTSVIAMTVLAASASLTTSRKATAQCGGQCNFQSCSAGCECRPSGGTHRCFPRHTAPSKPVWPEQFDAPFGLDVPQMGIKNETVHFYYDWSTQYTKIDYPVRCDPTLANTSCSIIFNNTGAWFLAPADDRPCCLLFPGVPSIPPHFLAPFNFSKVQNATDYHGTVKRCNLWEGPGQMPYWTDAATGADVELSDNRLGITWWWHWAPFNVRAQKASTFAMPDKCDQHCHIFPKDSPTPRPEDLFPMLRGRV